MSCNILTGIPKGCENNIGGITKFYITDFDGVTASCVTGTASAITTTNAFVEYEFNKNSSSFIEEAAISLENGSTYYTVTTNLVIPRKEVAKRNSLQLIAAGQQDLFIILKDGNGLYWTQGLTEGANLTAQGGGSGVVKADGSKYTLTFTSEEPEQMCELNDPAIIAALGLS